MPPLKPKVQLLASSRREGGEQRELGDPLCQDSCARHLYRLSHYVCGYSSCNIFRPWPYNVKYNSLRNERLDETDALETPMSSVSPSFVVSSPFLWHKSRCAFFCLASSSLSSGQCSVPAAVVFCQPLCLLCAILSTL